MIKEQQWHFGLTWADFVGLPYSSISSQDGIVCVLTSVEVIDIREIMGVSRILSHLGDQGNEMSLPIPSLNHVCPLPQLLNRCGNSFYPCNGIPLEVCQLK